MGTYDKEHSQVDRDLEDPLVVDGGCYPCLSIFWFFPIPLTKVLRLKPGWKKTKKRDAHTRPVRLNLKGKGGGYVK